MSGGGKLNWALLVIVVVVLALNWTLEPDLKQRNFEVLPGMVQAVSYESFTASAVLPGGVTQQVPPAGSIARGYMPMHFEPTPESARLAGETLSNPYSPTDSEALARGEEMFNIYCSICHGAGGLGDGTVAQRGFPTPASLLAPNARSIADGQILHIISVGQANMPGHASQIGREDRWKIVLWVRQLQETSDTEVEEVDYGP